MEVTATTLGKNYPPMPASPRMGMAWGEGVVGVMEVVGEEKIQELRHWSAWVVMTIRVMS